VSGTLRDIVVSYDIDLSYEVASDYILIVITFYILSPPKEEEIISFD
jgi:hypothetical protein